MIENNKLPTSISGEGQEQLAIDPQSLRANLLELSEVIKSFDKRNSTNGGLCVGQKIQELSEKKGKFCGIEYHQDPTKKELLDISSSIVTEVNKCFTNINEKVSTLHNTDEKIFKLLSILAGLSGMTYKRVKDAFSVIDDAQKNIDENCDVTSEQGLRIKQIALMHLQRIQEDKERYERLDAFIQKYTNEIDSLVQQFGSLEQHIEQKRVEIDQHVSDEKKHLENFANELKGLVKTEIDTYKKDTLSQLKQLSAIVDKQLSDSRQLSEKVLLDSENISRQLKETSDNIAQQLKTKEVEIEQQLSSGKEQMDSTLKNLLKSAIDDLAQAKNDNIHELETISAEGSRQLLESQKRSQEVLNESERLRNQMDSVSDNIQKQEERVYSSITQKHSDFNKEAKEVSASFVDLSNQKREEIEEFLIDYKEKLAKSYRIKYGIMVLSAISLSALISLIINYFI